MTLCAPTDFTPDDYKKGNFLQELTARKLISEITFKPTDRVLDIGCGDGKITFEISKLAKEGLVIGTDLNSEMIHSATKDYTSQTNNLGFMTMDGQKLIFQKQFDIIVSFNAIHWMPNQLEVLKGIWNALNPDGCCYLDVIIGGTCFDAFNSLQKHPKWKQYLSQEPIPLPIKSEYPSLLSRAGFQATITEQVVPVQFPSIEMFKQFIQGLPVPTSIPTNLKEEYTTDFLQAAVSLGGGLICNILRLVVQGRRRPEKLVAHL